MSGVEDVRAILFDVDDTLFDRRRAQRETARRIVQEVPDVFAGLDEETVAEAFLESDRVTTEEYERGEVAAAEFRMRRGRLFLGLLGLSKAHAREVAAAYVDLYPAVDAPVAGARSVVERLAVRFRLGVVSNGLPDVQYRKLETLGVRHLFACIVLSGEVGIHKPAPEIFWRAAELLAMAPAVCLYVGDVYQADVVGAKRAGMRACWFNPQGLAPTETDVMPDFEIRALEDIVGIVQ